MNKIICACGCGRKFIPSKKKVKYIHGHHNRGKHISTYGKTWEQMFGKERAEKRKIELGNKRRGKPTGLLGKSWEEQTPDKEKLLKRKIKARIRFLHKSYEEVYGEEKAKEIKWTMHTSMKLPVVDKEKILSIKLKSYQTIKPRKQIKL